MREIKFRAWDKEYEKMTIPYSLNELLQGASALHKCFQDDYIWMQYTGLKDRNNVEIYYGDIVLNKTYNWKSVVDELWVAHSLVERDKLNFSHEEVIGNIYENPELIEKAGP